MELVGTGGDVWGGVAGTGGDFWGSVACTYPHPSPASLSLVGVLLPHVIFDVEVFFCVLWSATYAWYSCSSLSARALCITFRTWFRGACFCWVVTLETEALALGSFGMVSSSTAFGSGAVSTLWILWPFVFFVGIASLLSADLLSMTAA